MGGLPGLPDRMDGLPGLPDRMDGLSDRMDGLPERYEVNDLPVAMKALLVQQETRLPLK